jgi:hypothetical protein
VFALASTDRGEAASPSPRLGGFGAEYARPHRMNGNWEGAVESCSGIVLAVVFTVLAVAIGAAVYDVWAGVSAILVTL